MQDSAQTNSQIHLGEGGKAPNFQRKIIPQKKSQSAMEYLMTYGWAILIIAVVLVALFQLGIFNANSFAPRAQPGACQVFKTVEGTSLEGECNNMLPQYVALFNGQSSISTGTSGLPAGSTARSVFAWVYWPGPGSGKYEYSIFGYGTWQVGNEEDILSIWDNNFVGLDCYGCAYTGSQIVSNNAWHFIGYTYAPGSNTVTFYIDKAAQNVIGGTPLNTLVTVATIGQYAGCGCNSYSFNGLIANVQIYNTSLSANDVQALYQEGIGGSPINPYNLVGWYPLNGNANDYSGNNNNGAATNVIYISSYTSQYTAP